MAHWESTGFSRPRFSVQFLALQVWGLLGSLLAAQRPLSAICGQSAVPTSAPHPAVSPGPGFCATCTWHTSPQLLSWVVTGPSGCPRLATVPTRGPAASVQ